MRAIVADDTALIREGVARILEGAGFDVVGKAADAEDLMRKVRAHKPDVAIVDIRMPPDNTDDGLRAAVAIREELPETGVLVLSQYVEEEYAVELLPRRLKVSGTCSRTGWRTWTASTRFAESPRGGRRSTPRW